MKRWLAVVMAAVAGFGIFRLWPQDVTVPVVKTLRLVPQLVEETVTCKGIVEAGKTHGVTAIANAVVEKVLVKKGEQVEAGEPLLRFDRAASRELLSPEDGGNAALTVATMPTVLPAPEAGIVTAVSAKAGETVAAGESVVQIAPLSGLQVRIGIREKVLRSLQVGQAAVISGEGFSRASYAGKLSSIATSAKTSDTGETVVEGVVTLAEGEADRSLRLGLTAKTKIVLSAHENALLLPYAAVRETEDGKEYVYVCRDGVARRVMFSGIAELADGVLTEEAALSGAAVILTPEKVPMDGAMVTEERT